MRVSQTPEHRPGVPERSVPATRSGASLWAGLARCLIGLAAAWPLLAGGAEVQRFELERIGNRYSVSVTATLDASRDAVWRVITDYARLTRLSAAIREGEVLSADKAQGVRVRSLTHLCALIFCKDVKQVQRIREQATGELEATTEPEGSDLAYGYARWQVVPAGRGSSLLIQFVLEPAFWIPPLVGSLAIKSALRQETQGLMQGIERAAREDAGP